VEAKNKLKSSENETFTNVFNQRRSSGRFPLGKWNADFFKNDNPVVLELGCGEYSVGLPRYPNKKFHWN
jgi:tRNA (guanine-N7-)-methyltransferase